MWYYFEKLRHRTYGKELIGYMIFVIKEKRNDPRGVDHVYNTCTTRVKHCVQLDRVSNSVT